jgi:hypothetical protein
MFLLAALLWTISSDKPADPPADYGAMARGLRAALPDGWEFVSAKPAAFEGHGPERCWLVTLQAKKEGDYNLVVEIDHDPAFSYAKLTASKCEYALSAGKAGATRSVADPFAAPNCCVGDNLVVPIPVVRGDRNHRFTFTAAARRHVLAHEYGSRVTEQKDEEPTFKVDNKGPEYLRLVSTAAATFSLVRSQDDNFRHRQTVILEAVKPGRLRLRVPVEVLPSDARLTAWVGEWYQTRSDQGTGRLVRGSEFAGPPQWTMRVGDRLKLEFENGPARTRNDPPPPLTVPVEKYAEPKEPFPIRP